MTEEITIDAGLATTLGRPDNDDAMVVSGIAIGEDEITHHANNDKFWSAEQLMAGTESLEGTQLTKNHNHDRVEGVIGEVTKAKYKEGVGILFEAEVYDTEVANKIEKGLLEVSVHAVHSNGGWTEDGEMIVENIQFRDLSVVPRGAAQSNEVKVGSLQPAVLSADGIEDMVAQEFDTYQAILEETAQEFDVSLEEHNELDEVYSAYHNAVNMTAGQLRSWSENPCSREASVRPTFVIRRNLRLLSKSKADWSEDDIADAKRTVSFIARMREQRPDNPRTGPVEGCPSKWAISLLNWAYNPFESLPDIPSDMDSVTEITLDEESAEEIEEELSEIHEVSYDGTEENDWSAPNLEDFPEEYFDSDGNAKFDLVDDHFLYSETQFPPENYTDLKFPVVSPDGMLNLAALRAAKSRAPQADIPVESQEEIQQIVNELVESEFGLDWTNAEESAESDDESDEDSLEGETQSSLAEDAESQERDTMTEETNENTEDIEALEERIAALEEQNESLESEVQSVRMEYAEALSGDSAFSAEELADKFTVEELADKYEDADVEIAEASAPAPQTGSMESEEVEASEEDAETEEEIAMLEAQIEQYDSMGWDSAKAEAEATLSELRDEDSE